MSESHRLIFQTAHPSRYPQVKRMAHCVECGQTEDIQLYRGRYYCKSHKRDQKRRCEIQVAEGIRLVTTLPENEINEGGRQT